MGHSPALQKTPQPSAGTVSAEAMARVGTRVGGCEIKGVIGEGGTGVVYRGRHVASDRLVAIKILHDHCARKKDVVEQFIGEARATSRIRHPNVIDVTDLGTTPDGTVFLAMEYLEGESLQNRLRRVRACHSSRPSTSSGRWHAGWARPTRPASSTAVSNRPTSSCAGGRAGAASSAAARRWHAPGGRARGELRPGQAARLRDGQVLRPGPRRTARVPGRCAARPTTCHPNRPRGGPPTSAATSTPWAPSFTRWSPGPSSSAANRCSISSGDTSRVR